LFITQGNENCSKFDSEIFFWPPISELQQFFLGTQKEKNKKNKSIFFQKFNCLSLRNDWRYFHYIWNVAFPKWRHLHSKFGAIRIRHHRAINVWKSWLCSSVNILTVLHVPCFLGPPTVCLDHQWNFYQDLFLLIFCTLDKNRCNSQTRTAIGLKFGTLIRSPKANVSIKFGANLINIIPRVINKFTWKQSWTSVMPTG